MIEHTSKHQKSKYPHLSRSPNVSTDTKNYHIIQNTKRNKNEKFEAV